MLHENVLTFYQVNFALMQHHKYSLSDIESMMPWERESYVALVQNYVKEENDRIREQNNGP